VDDLTLLADAAVHGDDAALAELVRRTHAMVRGVCRLLVDRDEVDDVVQDVYLRVVSALPRYRADAPVTPWLLTITRRTCADVVRRRRRQRRLLERVSVYHRRVDEGPYGSDVAGLLAGLDPDRRLAFVLTQVLGLSYEEAGAVCDCPIGTIRSRVSRARSDLAAAVERAESA
jgi:RNA polymerase sigma-70 factor (ECF subfamily)